MLAVAFGEALSLDKKVRDAITNRLKEIR